jgi:hypothetical protein
MKRERSRSRLVLTLIVLPWSDFIPPFDLLGRSSYTRGGEEGDSEKFLLPVSLFYLLALGRAIDGRETFFFATRTSFEQIGKRFVIGI